MVFPQDPEWQREYLRHKGGDATQHVRYRSWGTEELLVRCCMRYMPWIRLIHILLASESQEQDWMKRLGAESGKLRIVFHREFVPAEYLPCFSSPCFEMFLHRIPGLSEQFIYGNDDMFPLSPLEPEDFFRGGVPCQHITARVYPANPGVFQKKCMWQQNMIAKPFGRHITKTYPDTGHVFSPILKSSCEEVWRRHGDEITANLSPLTRTDRSANNWIFMLYQQYSGRYIDHRPTRHYTDQRTRTSEIAAIIRDPRAGIVCMNDNERITDWQERARIVREEIMEKLGCGAAAFAPDGGREAERIALVAIGRRENRYAREFVEHYLGLGFDHIFICDNNHDGEERFEDVLREWTDAGTVSIHDYRNREKAQMTAYNEIYARYGGDYDWIGFFDFDELLVMVGGLSVKGWLGARPDTADVTRVNWMCMTDSGLIYDDGRPMMERFTEAMPCDRAVQYPFPENNHVKSFVRGGLGKVQFTNPHVPVTPRNPRPSPFRPYDFSKAYLKHFTTKTIEEWMTNKMQKGVGDRSKAAFDRRYKDRFFRYNEETPEKRRYIDNYTSGYNGITVAVVHYNTPKLTRAAILSLWKHTPGCRVVVFDNSDRLPVGGCSEWDELRKSPLVTVVDNTEGQLISFGELLEQYPGRQAFDRNMSNFGSAKHTASVDRLFDMLPDGFVLMDSDVLIRQDISPLVDRGAAASGMLRPNDGVMRLLPLLCWLNVPVLRSHGIRYFNGEKMWALSDVYPNNRYDTGAWLLEEVRRCGLRLDEVDVKDYLIHLGHASWKGRRPMTWVSEHRDLWE